jgi:hypothetical protein
MESHFLEMNQAETRIACDSQVSQQFVMPYKNLK